VKVDLPNPLALIQQFALDGHEAEEILFCTFNQNLGFYERLIHAPCRTTGAIVTILADVDVADHDIVAIRNAGRGYTAVNVRSTRAFHPKLIAIVGRDHAVVAVGSGNLTDSGWWGNDELWTIHNASADFASPALPTIADWCRRLPDHVAVPGVGTDALHRVATLLERFQPSDGPTRALHTLDVPIIDQLPRGPVDDLNLFAPFHDAQTSATRQLIERFQPTRICLAYQPGLTSADGVTLAQLSRDYSIELIELDIDRYRHGKLVEWRIDGQWWALTGSANLSTAALCGTASKGGNIELAVLATADEPLLPAGVGAQLEQAAKLRRTGKIEGRRQVALLLAATLTAQGVHVEFARPIKDHASVRYSPPDALPGTWAHGPDIPAGAQSVLLSAIAAGGRVQLELAEGEFSNIVFVIDPVEATRRPRAYVGSTPRPAPTLDEVFETAAAARALLELASSLPKVASPTGPRISATETRHGDSDYSPRDWREYLEVAEAALSSTAMNFVLGLPLTASGGGATTPYRQDWDDDGSATTGTEDLEGDEPGELDEAAPAEAEVFSIEALRIAESKKVREHWWTTLRRHAPANTVGRILKLRMSLLFVAAGGRGHLSDDWVPDVLSEVTMLGAVDIPDELLANVGSIAAVALAATRTTLSTRLETVEHVRQRSAEAAVRHVVEHADVTEVTDYSKGLEGFFGVAVTAEVVLELAASVGANDPFADGLAAIRAMGWECTADGTHVALDNPSSNPLGVSLTAISKMRGVSLASVTCRYSDAPATEVLVCWVAPRLLVVKPTPKGGRWGAVYDLKGSGLTMVSNGALTEVSRREVEAFGHGQQPGTHAAEILAISGHSGDARGHGGAPE
jgi:hypothetical protein